MKFIKKCPLFLLIVITGLMLTGTALAGRNTVYADYVYDWSKTPPLSLVFLGLKDGVLPIEQKAAPIEENAEATAETTAEAVAETVTEELKAEESLAEASEEILEEDITYEFEAVTEEYFDDALFIGDSRTVGLFEYAGIEERAEFYCKTSLTIWDVLEKPIVNTVSGDKITIAQALSGQKFGKIYLMVGINELGRGNPDLFMEQYEKVVKEIRRLQPEAVLFVEGIMHVAEEKNDTDAIFNNTNINIRNERIKQLADNRNIFYIDVNEAVCDENGNLKEEYTFDQIHLKAAYYKIWKEFLLEKGIVK